MFVDDGAEDDGDGWTGGGGRVASDARASVCVSVHARLLARGGLYL